MADPSSLRVAVITISDSVSAGKSEDKSGPAVVARCRELGWEIKSSLVIPDDPPSIREQLRELARNSFEASFLPAEKKLDFLNRFDSAALRP